MNLIKEYRLESGYSQQAMADTIGITASYLSKIENNRVAPPQAIS